MCIRDRFGRDKIEWDQDWMSLLDQYQLKEFEADYSEEYLKKAGIDNEEMVTAIVQSSKAVSYTHLDVYKRQVLVHLLWQNWVKTKMLRPMCL